MRLPLQDRHKQQGWWYHFSIGWRLSATVKVKSVGVCWCHLKVASTQTTAILVRNGEQGDYRQDLQECVITAPSLTTDSNAFSWPLQQKKKGWVNVNLVQRFSTKKYFYWNNTWAEVYLTEKNLSPCLLKSFKVVFFFMVIHHCHIFSWHLWAIFTALKNWLEK